MPASGGAEISMFSLLRELIESGIRVTVFTSTKIRTSSQFGDDVGIDVHQVTTAGLTKALTQFSEATPVDVIATQNLWAEQAILFGRQSGIPSIYFARSVHGNLDLKIGGKFESSHIIANSQAVADFISEKFGRTPAIVRSIMRLEDYVASNGPRTFITIVNPLGHKGGETFRGIAELMPDRSFLAVEGWAHMRGNAGWDLEMFHDLCAGFGTDFWLPQESDFSTLSNVSYRTATTDMREVYRVTRILLVPSLYAESIPRVIFEAMVNGIPVIGSEIGGITEALSVSGLLVSNYRDPSAWTSAIRELDDPETYRRISQLSRQFVSSLDFSEEVRRCVSIFEEVSKVRDPQFQRPRN